MNDISVSPVSLLNLVSFPSLHATLTEGSFVAGLVSCNKTSTLCHFWFTETVRLAPLAHRRTKNKVRQVWSGLLWVYTEAKTRQDTKEVDLLHEVTVVVRVAA